MNSNMGELTRDWRLYIINGIHLERERERDRSAAPTYLVMALCSQLCIPSYRLLILIFAKSRPRVKVEVPKVIEL